jgi:hypothetical protein
MGRALKASWVHFCSLMVLLPVGWCCWLPDLRAAEAAPEPDCCCGKKETPKPARPTEPKPAPTCCCEPQPAVVRSTLDDGGDTNHTLPAFCELPTVGIIVPEVGSVDPASPPIDPSPRLHILHCVWLC